jgi:hypothetical protein
VRLATFSIHDVINDEPDACAFTVNEAPWPEVGMEVNVTLNSNTPRHLFNGAVQSVETTFEGEPKQQVCHAHAADDLAALDRVPFGTWTNISASTVAAELLASFAPGFTGTHIEAGLPTVSIILDGSEGWGGALRQIAGLIGGAFYVEDRDLHLFLTEATDTPDPIDLAHPFLYDPAIMASSDDSQLRTRVYGRGHGEAVLNDVPAGGTSIPVSNAAAWFSATGGQAISVTQRITYTGVGLANTPALNTWQTQTPAYPVGSVSWNDVIWVPALALFVAVGDSVAMTSPNGITWTAQTIPAGQYGGVAWSPTLALLVATNITTGTVATSPTGVTWTTRTPSEANAWQGITWAPALALFVAVASTGTHRVMTSPDGITWTMQTAASVQPWNAIVWAASLNLFVAQAYVGSGGVNCTMTSPTGVTWTIRASGNNLMALAWSPVLGLLVAVGGGAVGVGVVMTSADGITWTARAVPALNYWFDVIWADGLFLAVANTATGSPNQIMASADGVIWSTYTGAGVGAWTGIAWAPTIQRLVVVGASTGAIQVMTVTPDGSLTGIPASGTGSITLPLITGTPINIWVQRDDLTAQAAAAARETTAVRVSDGIHEYLVSDERRNEASLTALCDAHLAMFANPLVTVGYATRDVKTKSGKSIVVDLAVPDIDQTLTIQEVSITEIDVAPGTPPKFTATASTLRYSLEGMLRRLSGLIQE